MLVARFYFKPGCAEQWAWTADQSVVEQLYPSVWELIAFCEEIEDLLLDCIVYDGMNVTSLKVVSQQKEEEPKAKARRGRPRKNENKEQAE